MTQEPVQKIGRSRHLFTGTTTRGFVPWSNAS